MTARAPSALRVFRPRWGLVAAWVTGVLIVGGALLVEQIARGPLGASPANRWSLVVFAAFAAWLLWRLGGVSARPDHDGLVVRNVIRSRRLEWTQIVSVRFVRDEPWVILDLADGTTLAVMAIQRADGRRGVAEARRLAALVTQYGETPEPGRP